MKELEEISKSKTPLNDMYKMIPEKKKKSFLRLAKIFGYTQQRLGEALEDEKRRAGG